MTGLDIVLGLILLFVVIADIVYFIKYGNPFKNEVDFYGILVVSSCIVFIMSTIFYIFVSCFGI